MHSSGPCLQNKRYNNIAVVNGRGRKFGTQRRDTGIGTEWQCTMDDSGVILLFQVPINAKMANKWVIYSHLHSDFSPDI
jgi:hypothetical protein